MKIKKKYMSKELTALIVWSINNVILSFGQYVWSTIEPRPKAKGVLDPPSLGTDRERD